jgi:SET domain-containing protein
MTHNTKRDFSWVHQNLVAKETDSRGVGLFAIQDIPQNTVVVVFGGYVMTIEEELSLPNDVQDLAHQIADNLVLGVRSKSEIQIADHINHSCEPNCGFRGQIKLVTMRDIKTGEEITFDYAMVLFAPRAQDSYKLECMCGLDVCRRTITSEDWRLEGLQKKYRGFFQEYLEDKINNSIS